MNPTSFVKERISSTRYIWILIIVLLVLFSIVTLIQWYRSHRTVRQQSTVIERIAISPPNLSQHFYEQPISMILLLSIEMSVYDHVRDNYV